MWETFIRIPSQNGKTSYSILFDIVRFKIRPIVLRLRDDGIINWYCFLIHNKESGVPTSMDDKNAYFHIRLALKNEIKRNFPEFLPDYCIMTRKVEGNWVGQISITKQIKFDTSLLKEERIEEIWRIIGEQSEWLLNTLAVYKNDIAIPALHISEFMHYYANMTQLPVR